MSMQMDGVADSQTDWALLQHLQEREGESKPGS